MSDSLSLPSFSAPKTRSAVMSFAIEAGWNGSSAAFSKSTVPVS